MGNLVINQAAKFLRERRNTRRWIAVVLCLALVVTSGTFGALTRQGHALSDTNRKLVCAYTPHEHGEGCYNEAGEAACGYADYCVHTHNESCYDSEGELVCRLPEIEAHVHDESCYQAGQPLVCGLEESDGHHHTDSCYTIQQGEQVCSLEEHTHGGDCYTVSGGDAEMNCGLEEHSHTDECFSWNSVLTCTEEEGAGAHTHSESCYAPSVSGNDLSVSDNDAFPTCGQPELHTHDDSCFAPEDEAHINPICGKIVLEEHIHNEDCFVYAGFELTAEAEGVTLTVSVDKEGVLPENAQVSITPIVKPETPEEETEDAAADNTAYDRILAGLQATLAEDKAKEIVHFLAYEIRFTVENEDGETEQIQPQGPVALTMEFTGAALPQEIAEKESIQIADVHFAELTADEAGYQAKLRQDAKIKTTGESQLQKAELVLNQGGTVALSWVGEMNKYCYEDDQVVITVSAAEEGIIPENARLRVIPITASEETGEQYEQVAEKLLEKAENEEYDIAGFLAYDIAFIDEEGNEVEPNGEVKVTMNYKQAVMPEELNQANFALLDETDGETAEAEETGAEAGEEQPMNIGVTVMHLEEDENGQVAQVVDLAAENKVETLETTEEQAVEKTEFITDGFSVFTLTWTWDTSKPFVYEDEYVTITIEAIDRNAIPAEAELQVTPITAENEETAEQYQEVTRKLLEKAAEEKYEIAGFLAYDISLFDQNGTEIEPEGKVKVTMEYKQPMAVVEIDADVYALVSKEIEAAEKAAGTGEPAENQEPEENAQSETTVEENAAAEPEEGKAQEEGVQEEENENDLRQTGTEALEEIVEEDTLNKEKGSDEAEEFMSPSTIVIPLVPDEEQTNIPTQDVTVIHLEEDEMGVVTQVVDLNVTEMVENLEVSEVYEVERAEFVTESFSAFALTWTTYYGNKELKITFKDTNDNEITLPMDIADEMKATLKSGGEFDITQIKENGTGIYGKLYQIQADGDVYTFHRAANIWKDDGYDINGGTEFIGLQYTENAGIRWKRKESTSYENSVSNDAFYFIYSAEYKPLDIVTTTIDNKEYGITMNMADMSFAEQKQLFGDVSEWWTGGGVTSGAVQTILGEDGYPVVIPKGQGTGGSLGNLFQDKKPVNHLLQEKVHEGSKYLEYSCFENYAYLNADGNFTVYKQIGVPANGDGNQYFLKRGNFFPYNDIKSGKYARNYNLYDERGEALNKDDARYGERLYLAQETINYNFGMEMEVTFVQPEGGKVDGQNMVYEFNGDDDLWVFIDDVLVLDMGGNHNACYGYIDFSNGTVSVQGIGETKIRDIFQNAKRLPSSEGKSWNEEDAKNYFSNDTFSDYSTHTLKMFYLERGNEEWSNASNLHITMNLPIIPPETIEVEKRLAQTDQEHYTDIKFAYQVYAQKIKTPATENSNEEYYENEYELLKNAVYRGTETPIQFYDGQKLGKDGNVQTYDGVFYLRPGEIAQFTNVQKNRKYYVAEIGVTTREYDKVTINTTELTQYNGENQLPITVSNAFVSPIMNAGERSRVTYTNSCSLENQKELRITKKMKEGQSAGEDTFTFKVTLGTDLYGGDYYLTDKDGKCYFYNAEGKLEEYFITNEEGAKVPGTTPCGRKAENGLIKGVPADFTVAIVRIPSGTSFEVTEVFEEELKKKYLTPEIEGKEGTYKKVANATEGTISGKILLGENAEITITNSLKVQYSWELVKKSSTTSEGNLPILLPEARFKLEEANENGEKKDGGKSYYGKSEDDDSQTADLNERGIVAWYLDEACTTKSPTIPDGVYLLTETVAPAGYMINPEAWLVTISKEGKVTIKARDTEKGITVTEEKRKVNDEKEKEEKEVIVQRFYFENDPVYALPSTGGEGIYWYSIGGTLLMLAGALILYRNKKREEEVSASRGKC